LTFFFVAFFVAGFFLLTRSFLMPSGGSGSGEFYTAGPLWFVKAESATLSPLPGKSKTLSAPKSDPVGFLAACHQADSRSSSLLDVLQRDVQHRHFVTDTEVLLNGLQDGVAITLDEGIAAQKAAATYKREKSLIYAAFVVGGARVGSDGTERKLCAPIVYYPAKLVSTDVSGAPILFLTIDFRDQNVNFSLFAELLGDDDDASGAVEKLLARVPQPPFDDVAVSDLMQIFRDVLPHVDVDAMYRYPKLVGERGVRKAYRQSRLAVVPSAMMALISNPRAARGVLFELADRKLRETFSTPTRVLFGGDASPTVDVLAQRSGVASISVDPLASLPANRGVTEATARPSARRADLPHNRSVAERNVPSFFCHLGIVISSNLPTISKGIPVK
jgi:hypothetical protein